MTKTLRTLQAESSVCLNTIDNLDNLMSDINHGRWEAVMPQVRNLISDTFYTFTYMFSDAPAKWAASIVRVHSSCGSDICSWIRGKS